MKRPNPSGSYINALTGGQRDRIGALYAGAFETSLKEIYPLLNLDEAVAFMAASWMRRHTDMRTFRDMLGDEKNNIYGLFNAVTRTPLVVGIRYGPEGAINTRNWHNAYEWINRYRAIVTEKHNRDNEKLNPFKGNNLEARLKHADPEVVRKLISKLEDLPKEHIFGVERGKYLDRGYHPDKLKVMGFQNEHPPSKKKGEEHFQNQWKIMIENFAGEIARILKEYPVEYDPDIAGRPIPQQVILPTIDEKTGQVIMDF